MTALCGLTIWACGGSDKEKIQAVGLSQGCTLNSECADPLVCTFARCHNQCAKDRDCSGEERCVKGITGFVCQLPVETDCTTSSTVCKGSQVCGADGECRDSCSVDKDCTTGQVCAPSGECASTEATKDQLDEDGTILEDPFHDPDPLTTGGTSGTGKGGASGKGGEVSASGGTGGAGGDSSGGTPSVSGKTGAGGKATAAGGKSAGGASSSGGLVGTGGEPMGGAGGFGPLECPAGKGDCDSNPRDCETLLTLPTSCGACDVACMSVHGTSVCDATTLKCVVSSGTCATGYADCNKTGNDGCEVSLTTDPANCGTCGHSCGGGMCMGSQCMGAVVFDPTGAGTGVSYNYTGEAFLVGSQLLKLNTQNGTEIRTVTLPTTATTIQGTVLVTTTNAYSVHVDATNIYYGLSGNPATVLWKPLNGTLATPAKTAVTMPDSYHAIHMTSNATAFYFVNNNNNILTASKSLTGTGTTAAVVPGLNGRTAISQLVVAGSYIYWVESPNVVYAAPLAGGTTGVAVVIDASTANGYYTSQSLTTDNTYVYWTAINGASSKIRRIPVAAVPSTTAVEEVTVGIAAPSVGIVVDATYLYYAYTTSAVWRVKKDGSATPEQIGNVSSPYFYNMFGVDSGYVYGNGSSGQILRIAKGTVIAP